MPRVSTRTAATVNPGAFQSCRTANRRSCIILPVRCGEELRRIQILSPFSSEPRADRDSKSVSVAARLRSFPEMSGKTRIRQAARKRGAQEVVQIDQQPLRRAAGSEGAAAMGRLEELRVAWNRFEREDKPNFVRWRAREFGPLL